MKVSTRDKKILLMFLGVFFLAVSYLFVYRPQMEEAARIEEENGPLSQRLAELLDMAKNREQYETEINQMQEEIREYCAEFPSMVQAEDGIVLAKNMEQEIDIRITDIGLELPELLATLEDDQTETTEEERETLSKQVNDRVEDSLSPLEGEEGEEVQELRQELERAYQPTLYRRQNRMQFSCTYEALKDTIRYLAADGRRRNLDTLNASYDSSTGNLTGSLTANLFFMTGAGSEYTKPDGGTVPYGTDNIFGTIERAPENGAEGENGEGAGGENGEGAEGAGEGNGGAGETDGNGEQAAGTEPAENAGGDAAREPVENTEGES